MTPRAITWPSGAMAGVARGPLPNGLLNGLRRYAKVANNFPVTASYLAICSSSLPGVLKSR